MDLHYRVKVIWVVDCQCGSQHDIKMDGFSQSFKCECGLEYVLTSKNSLSINFAEVRPGE